jgi:hypothetical protein
MAGSIRSRLPPPVLSCPVLSCPVPVKFLNFFPLVASGRPHSTPGPPVPSSFFFHLSLVPSVSSTTSSETTLSSLARVDISSPCREIFPPSNSLHQQHRRLARAVCLPLEFISSFPRHATPRHATPHHTTKRCPTQPAEVLDNHLTARKSLQPRPSACPRNTRLHHPLPPEKNHTPHTPPDLSTRHLATVCSACLLALLLPSEQLSTLRSPPSINIVDRGAGFQRHQPPSAIESTLVHRPRPKIPSLPP